ncbi:MAG: DNA-directed RNA polymerase subunit omega [Holosporales bacterium]
MARVTVEDCIKLIPNRFELVLMAAQRTRAIASGSSITVQRNNDKNPVISLREIANETINIEELRKNLLKTLQNNTLFSDVDESVDEDTQELILAEQEDWSLNEIADEDLLDLHEEDESGVDLEEDTE